MTRIATTLGLCLSLSALLPFAANAETLQQSKAAYKAACKADLKKFCANSDKKGACLKAHAAEIAPECLSARKAYRAAKKLDSKQEEPRS